MQSTPYIRISASTLGRRSGLTSWTGAIEEWGGRSTCGTQPPHRIAGLDLRLWTAGARLQRLRRSAGRLDHSPAIALKQTCGPTPISTTALRRTRPPARRTDRPASTPMRLLSALRRAARACASGDVASGLDTRRLGNRRRPRSVPRAALPPASDTADQL